MKLQIKHWNVNKILNPVVYVEKNKELKLDSNVKCIISDTDKEYDGIICSGIIKNPYDINVFKEINFDDNYVAILLNCKWYGFSNSNGFLEILKNEV